MSIADAIAAARSSIAQAESAAAADVSSGEADATWGTTQAQAAYQLAIQILRDKTVELAPALLELEAAAIGKGIATYLEDEAQAAVIEKKVFAEAEAAARQLRLASEKAAVGEEAASRADAARVQALSHVGIEPAADVRGAVREALARVKVAVAAAVAAGVDQT